MITRRSFIIGAASALTLSLVDKFINYADKHGEPMILAPKRPGDILYAFPSRDFQLGLNGDPWKLDNPDMTWRQFLVELFNYPNPVKLNQFKEIECDWGIKPTMLDEPVPSEHL